MNIEKSDKKYFRKIKLEKIADENEEYNYTELEVVLKNTNEAFKAQRNDLTFPNIKKLYEMYSSGIINVNDIIIFNLFKKFDIVSILVDFIFRPESNSERSGFSLYIFCCLTMSDNLFCLLIRETKFVENFHKLLRIINENDETSLKLLIISLNNLCCESSMIDEIDKLNFIDVIDFYRTKNSLLSHSLVFIKNYTLREHPNDGRFVDSIFIFLLKCVDSLSGGFMGKLESLHNGNVNFLDDEFKNNIVYVFFQETMYDCFNADMFYRSNFQDFLYERIPFLPNIIFDIYSFVLKKTYLLQIQHNNIDLLSQLKVKINDVDNYISTKNYSTNVLQSLVKYVSVYINYDPSIQVDFLFKYITFALTHYMDTYCNSKSSFGELLICCINKIDLTNTDIYNNIDFSSIFNLLSDFLYISPKEVTNSIINLHQRVKSTQLINDFDNKLKESDILSMIRRELEGKDETEDIHLTFITEFKRLLN